MRMESVTAKSAISFRIRLVKYDPLPIFLKKRASQSVKNETTQVNNAVSNAYVSKAPTIFMRASKMNIMLINAEKISSVNRV